MEEAIERFKGNLKKILEAKESKKFKELLSKSKELYGCLPTSLLFFPYCLTFLPMFCR